MVMGIKILSKLVKGFCSCYHVRTNQLKGGTKWLLLILNFIFYVSNKPSLDFWLRASAVVKAVNRALF